MQPNIVFLDEYSLGDADLGSIRALGNYTGYRTTVREEVADRCREADVVITNKVVFRRETLRQLPRLRLICVAATGMNRPLAHMLRKRLHKVGIRRGFRAVFSPEPMREGAMILCEEQNKKSNVGTISYIPALFGIGCASVVIRDLIGELEG